MSGKPHKGRKPSASKATKNPSVNLSGQSVEDVLRALVKTPPPKDEGANRDPKARKKDGG